MTAIDTNVIIRFLVNNDAQQAATVRELFETAEKNKESFLIPIPVVLETIWVLSAVYDCTRDDILEALEHLLMLPVIKFEAQDRVYQLCKEARHTSVDLADILIGLTASDLGASPVLTFDKTAARTNLFELL